MKKIVIALLLLFALPMIAHADDEIYVVYKEDGAPLFEIQEVIAVDDEYISADNALYKVISVDETNHTAQAAFVNMEPMEQWVMGGIDALPVFAAAGAEKLIAIYSTHSDESYVPSDGVSSKNSGAGIYDVDEALQRELESLGITVKLDKTTHLPHDAGAYRRSRQTAEDLMKQRPAALIDVHRDGIPDPKSYMATINGNDASKVRLLVGRSNPNSAANRAFAKRIKAVADRQYPGLIKDIFIGKGNYNQELMPKSILLEFGTYTMSKERAIESTKFIANVLNEAIFGTTAQAQANEITADAQSSSGAGMGIFWFVLVAAVAAAVFAWLNAGSASGAWDKVKRGASEMSGGLIGKKPKDRE